MKKKNKKGLTVIRTTRLSVYKYSKKKEQKETKKFMEGFYELMVKKGLYPPIKKNKENKK